jgi:shikimate dehydrogenase
MPHFGLIGYPLSHSFSKRYFTDKFAELDLTETHSYELYPLARIGDFPQLLREQPTLRGLNVTIPYKQSVIPYLDKLSPAAAEIGAVNTIDIRAGFLTGYNTDVIGFQRDLEDLLGEELPQLALILGTGGAALAVKWVLDQMGISATFVSRHPAAGQLGYQELAKDLLLRHRLIVNTTPLGMSPRVDSKPDIDYSVLGEDHFLYDLVYNPEVTQFLAEGNLRGAATRNGLSMLQQQADAAWEIWTAI